MAYQNTDVFCGGFLPVKKMWCAVLALGNSHKCRKTDGLVSASVWVAVAVAHGCGISAVLGYDCD